MYFSVGCDVSVPLEHFLPDPRTQKSKRGLPGKIASCSNDGMCTIVLWHNHFKVKISVFKIIYTVGTPGKRNGAPPNSCLEHSAHFMSSVSIVWNWMHLFPDVNCTHLVVPRTSSKKDIFPDKENYGRSIARRTNGLSTVLKEVTSLCK